MSDREQVRVLALWSPDWPVTAAARAAHVPAHHPAAVVVANRVLACSAVARARGVRRGLRRREAQARCPELAVLHCDADRDAREFEPVVTAVEELAPGVEVVRPGLVVLPARGPAGFFGGEQAAEERLVDQVAVRAGVECQVGLADGLFAAVLAARRGVAVGAGHTPAFLAPLGVEELDREPDVDRSELVGLLHRLGLRSLGAFGGLAAADVASRFGADAVLAHRLARGLDPRPPARRAPPEELTVEVELDPPVDRVDAAAFAARALAERLHRMLAGHGLSCTRLGVLARTGAGEELRRVWRCAEPLTPSGTAARVRWQLDAWLARGGSGALHRLALVPEETVTAGALQLGLWGDVGEGDERALVRVQALLGPEAVVTAVLVGGRDPVERVRLVPWGDERPAEAPGQGAADGAQAQAEPRTSPFRGHRRPGSTSEPGARVTATAATPVSVAAPPGTHHREGHEGCPDRRPTHLAESGRPDRVGADALPGLKVPGAGGAGSGGDPAPGAAAGLRAVPAGWPDDVVRATGRSRARLGSGMAGSGGRPTEDTWSGGPGAGAAGSGGPGLGVTGSGGLEAGVTGSDGPRAGIAGSDGPRAGIAGSDGPRAGIAGSDGPRTGIAGSDGPRTGIAGSDGPRTGIAGSDGPRTGIAGSDGPRTGIAGSDVRGAGTGGSGPGVAGSGPGAGTASAARAGTSQGPYGPGSAGGRRRSPPVRSSGRVSGRPAVRDGPASWPGRLPAPSPAAVPPEPVPVELLDHAGRPVLLAAPDLLAAVPHRIRADGPRAGPGAGAASADTRAGPGVGAASADTRAGPGVGADGPRAGPGVGADGPRAGPGVGADGSRAGPGAGSASADTREVVAWAGPWPVWQRWWTPGSGTDSRLQVVCADGTALLLLARAGRWWVSGIYD